MTEAEWLAATDPLAMMHALRARDRIRPERRWFRWLLAGRPADWKGPAAGDRKLWLFALACCWRVQSALSQATVPPPLPGESFVDPREALHLADQMLEGGMAAGPMQGNLRYYMPVSVSAEDHALAAAYYAACDLFNEGRQEYVVAMRSSIEPRGGSIVGIRSSGEVRRAVATAASGLVSPSGSPQWHATWISADHHESAVHAALLRCLFGNPFRRLPAFDPEWLAWNGGTVGALARTIYDARDFDRLPLLADALEDAGCTDAEILGHLRGPGPHVRGCWAVDLILARE